MKVTLHSKANYDGLGFSLSRLKKSRKVELLGVPMPVDPGVVKIKDGDKEYNVMEACLTGCPRIDFQKLLSKKQIKIRENFCLFGNGIGKFTSVLPIERALLTK